MNCFLNLLKYPQCNSGVFFFMLKKKPLFVVITVLFFLSCGHQPAEIPDSQILAKIGDRIITKDEFLRRAEYTIRPNYCRGDNYIHRKIVLNSLIAEKLLAMEAGTDNKLAENERFRKYIQGRKEQAMRQMFYHDRAYKKVKLDSNIVKNYFQSAGRTYEVQYLRLPNKESALTAYSLYTDKGVPFSEIAGEVLPDSQIPSRKIDFNSDINDEMFEMFFSHPLQKDQMLNPVRIDDGSYLIMKIKGWEDERALGEGAVRRRLKDVTEKLHTVQANRLYAQQVADIMKGKSVVFTEDTFREIVKIVGPRYLKSMQDKKNAFNRQFWGQANEVVLDSSIDYSGDRLVDKPFFNLDGQIWTVADFAELVESHPLVFRKRQISKSEFPEQFKLAVVDLIRDHFITAEAYKAGYDQNIYVKNHARMWSDAMMSDYWRDQYLQNRGFRGDFQKEYLSAIKNYLNPLVDSLQTKYSNEISINTDLFETIELTHIDLFALQAGVPYPIVSPGFPILTTDSKLNYGSKMEVK